MIRAVEFLVVRGHNLHSILYEYTIDQVTAFYEAALENYKNSVHDYAFAVRIAQHGKDKDFNEYIKGNEKKNKILSSKERKELKDKLNKGGLGGLSKGNRKAGNYIRRSDKRA